MGAPPEQMGVVGMLIIKNSIRSMSDFYALSFKQEDRAAYNHSYSLHVDMPDIIVGFVTSIIARPLSSATALDAMSMYGSWCNIDA